MQFRLKQWWIGVVLLVLAACGTPAVQTVARFDEVTLTRPVLDERVALVQDALTQQLGANAGGGAAPPLPSNQEIEQQLVQLFIQQNLVLSVARDRGVEVSDAEVDEQINLIRTSVEQSGQNLDDAVKGNLGYPDAASTDFRQFVSSLVAQEKLGETLVTSDTATVEQVRSAHILVETEEEAQQVLERLNAGEDFGALAQELSKDPGSGAQGGELGWVGRGQFVPEFEQAIFEDLQPGETTETPVQTQFGYHVIRVLERANRADPQQLEVQRQQAVQELLETERTKAVEAGRLEEPTYPEPTPIAPPSDPGAAPGTTQENVPTGATAEPTAQP